MKARILKSIGNLELCDCLKPKLNKGDVLVKVHSCGICGSDIPRIFVTGTYHFPTIPGHEFAGEVVSAFDDENKHLVGKRATIFPLIPCKSCENCNKGNYEMCSNYNYLGSRTDGGFAEYVKVPAWNILPIPNNISYDEAAMAEPCAVALHALRKAKVELGDIVTIFGLGPIGLLIAQFAKAWGAKVLLVGVNSNNYNFVKSLGFSHYCNSSKEDALKWIMDKTDGHGTDIAIEATGSQEAACNCLEATTAGGKVVFVGNPRSDFTFPKDTYWKILRKQLTIFGTWNSSYNHTKKSDWNIVIDSMSNNEINPEKLITHKFSLEDMDKGLDIMKNRTEYSVKIMINPTQA